MVDERRYGIGRAKDASGRGFGRAAIAQTPPPYTKPLRCTGRVCTAELDAVIGHPQSPVAFLNLARVRHTRHSAARQASQVRERMRVDSRAFAAACAT